MELNEDQSNENKERLFIQSLLYSKGVSYPQLCFGSYSKAGRGMKKAKDSGMPWLEAVDMGKL